MRHVPPELPRLDGPEGTESLVAQRFLAVQDRLGGLGLQVAALRLDARGAWELDLSTGVTVRLGRRQVDERMDRFVEFGAQVIAGQRGRDPLRRHALFERLCDRLARQPQAEATPVRRQLREIRDRWLSVPTAT